MTTITRALIVFALITPSYATSLPLYEFPKHKYAYWKAAFQQVLPSENADVALAEEIFNRVRFASNIASHQPIRLLITSENPIGTLLTISLEDGTVVLSLQALQEILATENGSHKLAFVFGHELAHIENNIKLSHLQTNLRNETKLRHISYFMKSETEHENKQQFDTIAAEELLADKLGIMNMLMAGYEPTYIFAGECESSFFAKWQELLDSYTRGQSAVDITHRCQIIAKELTVLDEKGPLFEIGLNFLIAGYYHEAINAFEEMLNSYKGREIYLNLGMAYHKLAIEDYKPSEADRSLPFQCSVLIDPLYRAKIRSAVDKNKNRFTSNINKAIDFYKAAIEKDKHYSNAYANIGCAYLLQGKNSFSMGYLQEALEHDPDNPYLLNNYAIASYYLGKQPEARQALEKALAVEIQPTILYNLGVLAARANDTKSAKNWFTQYKQSTSQQDWLRTISQKGYVAKQSRRAFRHIEKIGAIKPGMSLDDIKRTSTALREHKSYIENLPTLTVFENGIITLSEGDMVLIAMANDRHTGRTSLGIGIGSKKEDVVSQYGEPSETFRTSFGTCLKFSDQHISFIINNNKVSKWLVNLSP